MSPDDPRFSHPKAIDFRHAQMLASLCETMRPETVLEIGSFQGASTSVFVRALELGHIKRLALIEPNPTPELLRLVAASSAHDSIRIFPDRFTPQHLTVCTPDLVFIDGDHRAPDLLAATACIAAEIPIVAMHDICHAGHVVPEEVWGSVQGWKMLAGHYALSVSDERPRPNERTARGFGMAFYDFPENPPALFGPLNALAD